MAGTLTYRIKVDHIYQRRFDLPDFATALAESHWYLITRRPAVRILPGSVKLDDDIVTLDVVTREHVDAPQRVHTVGADFRQFGRPHDFEIMAEGAYFSMMLDDNVFHGDTWALASLLTGAGIELACQETLYVGQSFGTNGSSNAWIRTGNHKKLQRIYEDHVGTDYDIFVVPLSLDRRMWSSTDHLDDDDWGPDSAAYYELFADPDTGGMRKGSVNLVEHSLISHFIPFYNEKLTEWRADQPTETMLQMRSAGFRLLTVHLSGWWGLARFYSTQVPDLVRSHFISQDLPPEPHKAVLRGISAETLGQAWPEAMVVREANDYVSEKAEQSGVILRVFGDAAPQIRKPPASTFGALHRELTHITPNMEARTALRTQIQAERDQREQASRPIFHPGVSRYDADTGMIQVGEYSDGAPMTWRLHDPKTGAVASCLIFGEPGSGKSSILNVIALEAMLTELFVIMPLDPSNRNDYTRLWRSNRWITTNVEETIERLAAIRRIIDYRRDKNIFTGPAGDIPGVLVTLDDAEPILDESGGPELIGKILGDGGPAGVGLVMAIRDIDVLRPHPDLLRALLPYSKFAFTSRGPAILAELNATYGDERPHTGSERLSFVLHCGPAVTTLGLIVGLCDRAMPPPKAQAWCDSVLQAHGVEQLYWQSVADESLSWEAMAALSMRFWFLRRHDDVWCLVHIICRQGKVQSMVDAIQWASAQIDHRFQCTLGQWQRGPAPWQDGVRAFYADVLDDLAAKDTSEWYRRMILDMH
jgi:hypothetical protein